MHHELARAALKKGYKRICVKAPRGSAKTTLLGTILPLHYICYSQQPELIVITSSTQDLAMKTLDAIKSVAESPIVRSIYGDIGSRASSKFWAEDEASFRHDMIMVRARGLNQQLRGLHYRNQRPTLIVLDDPDDNETAKSPSLLESHWKRLTAELLPALDPIRGRIIVIGTPVHAACIVERLRDNESWIYYHYKALYEVEEAHCDWPDSQRYVSYWPTFHKLENLLRDRHIAEREGRLAEWWAEYMCEIIGNESAPFQEHMMRYYEGKLQITEHGHFLQGQLLDDDELIDSTVTVSMGVDPAASVSPGADFTAIVVLARTPRDQYFVLEAMRMKTAPIQAADRIIALYDRYKPHRVVVETQGYQEMLRNYLKQQRPYMPIFGMKAPPTTKKETRLLSLQPEFAVGRIFIRTDHSDLRKELLEFPRSAHDDLMDALYYAWRASIPAMGIAKPNDKSTSRYGFSPNWMTL